jgi:hypothetical protein
MSKIAFIIIVFSIVACKRGPAILNTHFDKNNLPPEVNYNVSEGWAALPDRLDAADSVPAKSNTQDGQKNAKVDVFFIHPTIFTYKPTNSYQWNADINDDFLNKKTDNSSILNQASAFNGSCRVYAPRYRQAHYYSFVTNNLDDSKQALDLAYSDVKRAFENFLQTKNNGRPIIIASHSQGTVHAKRLLVDFFEGKPLQKKLVCAYIIGIAINKNSFSSLKPSQKPNDVGCYATWNTFTKGYFPTYYNKALVNSVCTNPLTWSSDDSYAPQAQNLGGIGPKFKFFPQVVDAQNNRGILWVGRPKIPGAFFIRKKNWHIADINFFWMNIRENVGVRINSYFAQNN